MLPDNFIQDSFRHSKHLGARRRIIVLFLLAVMFLAGCSEVDPYLMQADGEWPNLANPNVEIDETFETTTIPDEVMITPPTSETVAAEEPEQKVEYLYEVSEEMSAILPIERKNATQGVLLTFDGVPSENTPELLVKLAEVNAKAVFFINTDQLENPKARQIVEQIHEAGHMLGNGAKPGMTNFASEQQKDYIVEVSRLIRNVSGSYPILFRPVWADYDWQTSELVESFNMSLITWGYCYDASPEYQDAASLTNISLNTSLLNSGVVVLMHPFSWTIEAIPGLVNGYRNLHYEVIDPHTIAPRTRVDAPNPIDDEAGEGHEAGEPYYEAQDDIPAAGHS